MTEESKGTEKEESADSEIKPPMPYVPAEANPPPFPPSEHRPEPEPAPASPSAQMKMAGEIESGGTPYNYSGELEGDHLSGKPPPVVSRFSLTNVAALTAVVALALITVLGWRIIENVSIKIDGINSNVEKLADRFLLESRLAKKTGRAVVRAELQKSLKSLEHVIATGDPVVKAEAVKLKNKIREVMALIGTGAVEQQIYTQDRAGAEPELEPEPKPKDDIKATPSEGEVEPGLPANAGQERPEVTKEEQTQPL